ncbi:MAG: cob(I)yrinic acid a,c-diamide adenosyltransferase [Planctomycetota bacterium]
MLEAGLVQIYTGDGKGKTTAMLGLALRAAGHGRSSLICQFLKPASLELGERRALKAAHLLITIQPFSQAWDMNRSFDDKGAFEQARKAIHERLTEIADLAACRSHDLIILDEIVFCLSKGLAELADIKKIIDRRHRGVELVLTGRGATAELIELADLVTEMKNIKHPFEKSIGARKGIEY